MYRILIVEDDEIIARSLKKHLESWDYDVVCVEDFSDVMKKFAGAAPQLVLDFLYVLISMNISLGVFNLIPVPPFDGSRIVLLFLPQKLYFQAMRYEKYIMGVVLLLVFFGLLNTPLNLCVNAAWRLLLNLTGFVELLFGIA